MKAVYKWRLENGVYGYITDEQDKNAFIYDQTTFEREYPDGTVVSGSSIDEPVIANIVSKKSKSEYIQMFNEFKEFVNIEYPGVSFLDVMYYYNVENDECSASAGTLKCAGSDVLFKVKNVTSGFQPQVTIETINSDPEMGDLRYDMSFVLPLSFVSGDTPTFDSVIAGAFIKSGGTSEQYLMADGSVSVLSAGTNVTITTATTLHGKVVTISSNAANNTWRNVKVNDIEILDNSTVSGLTLSAGTNVTLATSDSGNNKVVTINASGTNTWRNINVNNAQLLDDSTVSGLTLSAGTNVTLTTGSANGNKIVYISATGGGGGGNYQNGRNITIDGDNKINAEGYAFDSGITSVVLFDDGRIDTGLKYNGMFSVPLIITTNQNPVGVINNSDTLLIGNKLYQVDSIGSAPPTIKFSQAFDYTGTDIGTTIYKIDTNKNVAFAKRTFAAGTGTIAHKENMTVVGEYNYVENIQNKSDILFSVGNGTQSGRSNAFIVRKDGSIHIHPTVDQTSTKHYGGRIDFGDGSTEKANVYIEEDTDNHLSIKSNEGVTFTTGDGNVEIYSDARVSAKVNGVENVHLGMPIGSITMWAGKEDNLPYGWELCNGYKIELTSGGITDYDWAWDYTGHGGNYAYYKVVKSNDKKFINLLDVIITEYGFDGLPPYDMTAVYLPNLQQRFPLGAKSGGHFGKKDTIEVSLTKSILDISPSSVLTSIQLNTEETMIDLTKANYKKSGTGNYYKIINSTLSGMSESGYYIYSEVTVCKCDEELNIINGSTNESIFDLFEIPSGSLITSTFPLYILYDTDLGFTGGTSTHKLTIDEMPSHNHDFKITQGQEARSNWAAGGSILGSKGTFDGNRTNMKHINSDGYDDELIFNRADTANRQFAGTGSPGSSAQFEIVNAGGGLTHNNVPPYLAVNFIIKYK